MLQQTKLLFRYHRKALVLSESLAYRSSTNPVEKLAYENLRQKIVYNSMLIQHEIEYLTYFQRKRLRYKELKQQYGDFSETAVPIDSIVLKYLRTTAPKDNATEKPQAAESGDAEIPLFPYEKSVVKLKDTLNWQITDSEQEETEWLSSSQKVVRKMVKDKNWLPHDPDFRSDAVKIEEESVNLKYGSADPYTPVSKVACGGCGALLHCQDTAIPGFLPKEVFEGLNASELKTQVCQRCHFLKDYDVALGVDVAPEDYPKILGHLKYTRALVLLMVDLLDMPCSIWPGMMDLIGHRRPVVVVANKVDLIAQDSPEFFDNVRQSLLECMLDAGVPQANIKHIALISAKTGFGVESLITKLHTSWRYQGDIYIVGCTNVGKSTLFNTLIQSDLCKVQAIDLMQKATVSEWPGTTLNLLKFPILRPSSWRIYMRTERMRNQEKKELEEFALRSESLKRSKYAKQTSLAGTVGRTFAPESAALSHTSDPFSVAITNNPRGVSPLGLNPNSKAFANSKWCYDTPGVVHPDQALNLLTTSEILATVAKQLIIPRVFHLQPGYSLLIGGLGRMDFESGPDFVWFTVFAAESLPLSVVKTEDAETVYCELLGTEILKVPSGNSERLKKWPGLKEKTLEVCGKRCDEVAADLVLSSAGWIAVTLQPAEFCLLRAWTPGARGIHLRSPFVKRAHRFRGSRIRKTPAFRTIVDSSTD